MAESIEFDLKVVRDEVKKALDDNIAKAGKLDVAIGSAIGSFAGGLAVKGFELLGSAISGTVDFLKDAVKEAQEEEKALNDLSNALKRTGDFSNTAIDSFSRFSDELAANSVFADDVILQQVALAKSLGATNTQAKSLVSAAANLSAILGTDLNTSTEQLTKTLSGSAGRLAQFIPELKSLTKEQLAAGAAIDIINGKFGGAAAGQVNTYGGAVNQLSKAYSNLQEAVGNFVIKNPAVVSAIATITSGLKSFTSVVDDARRSLGIGLTPIEEQRKKLNELGDSYNEVTERIKERNAFAAQEAAAGNTEREKVFLQQAAQLEAQRNNILKERQSIRAALRQDAETKDAAKPDEALTSQELAQRAQLNAELLNLDRQLELERDIQSEQFRAARLSAAQEGQASEIDRELQFALQQNEIAFQNELAKNQLIENATQQRLANDAAAKKKLIADEKAFGKANVDQAKQDLIFAQRTSQAKLDLFQATANLGAAIAKDGSKEQFLIQKASAIAGSIVATQLAAAQALAVPPAPNVALASFAKATGALNTAAIVATAVKGFAGGGIVGATNGPDNRIATVRDGEMVLNAGQQKQLFDAINGGSMGGTIIVQVDGREIARAVRNQVEQGFKIA